MYSTPPALPFRLSYKGLGEPLCAAAFGPLATTAFYLAQLPPPPAITITTTAAAPAAAAAAAAASGAAVPVPAVVWAAAAVVGATTASILFCSHFHQIEGDSAAGKRSPLVRLGHQSAAEVLRLGAIATYVGAATACHRGVLPPAVAWGLAATLPRCVRMLMHCHANHWSPERVRPLKFYAIRWHSAVGVALAIGLVAERLLAQQGSSLSLAAIAAVALIFFKPSRY